jgi:nucleotide-binding universal stress UspA family protein
MYKHILVPTDGTALSQKAVKTATRLARSLKARMTTLYVMAPYSPPAESEMAAFYPAYSARGYEQHIRKVAERALTRAKRTATQAGVKSQGIAVFHGSPWQSIVNAARGRKCDLIVMASHGRRGLIGVLLGSETQKVLTHSKIPVLVCR